MQAKPRPTGNSLPYATKICGSPVIFVKFGLALCVKWNLDVRIMYCIVCREKIRVKDKATKKDVNKAGYYWLPVSDRRNEVYLLLNFDIVFHSKCF
jgi:hypothetical protein